MFQILNRQHHFNNSSLNIIVDVLKLLAMISFIGAVGGCASDAGLKATNQDASLAIFSKTIKPFSPNVWAELNASSSVGVMFIIEQSGDPQKVAAYIFANTPEDALLNSSNRYGPDSICIFRYRDSVPIAPQAKPCREYLEIVQLRIAIEKLSSEVTNSEKNNIANLRAIGQSVKQLNASVSETLQQIRGDIAAR